jgi:Ca2+/H+ antiporter, TMEM165/GDT1 family
MHYFKNSNYRKRRFFFFFLIFPALFLAIGGIVMYLWNGILPDVIHVGTISYLQALGILILSKILFSGFRHGYHGGHEHMHGRLHHFKEKWENMTDEEKAKYKEEWKNCCHPNKG